MVSHEPAFVLLFLPLALGLFWLTARFRPGWSVAALLAASLAFYAIADPRHLTMAGLLVLANYGLGRRIATAPAGSARNLALTAGVALNLGLLAFHKYAAAFLPGPAAAPPTGLAQAAMPLGLSFIVLQQITWLVDLWRAPPASAPALALPLGRFGLYSLFFPQMIAGPILRYEDGAQAYAELGRRPPAANDVARGLSLFSVGLAKKVLIADQIGRIADPLFAAAGAGYAPTFTEAWLAGVAFLMQLYFDVSGISDMAIGIGLMVGLRLPINFNSPLKARNGSECFDRWHMSLTAFVRAYVFTPLYGLIRRRAQGKAARRSMIAWAGATVVSLSLVGWWHGAQPTFVISGFLIGVAAVGLQLHAARRGTPAGAAPGRLAGLGGRAVILTGLMVFGVFFRAPDLATVGRILAGLVRPWTVSVGARVGALLPEPVREAVAVGGFLPGAPMPPMIAFVALAAGLVIAFAAPNTLQVFGLWDHPGAPAAAPIRRLAWRPGALWAGLCALLLVAAVVASVGIEPRAALYGAF